MHFCVSYLKYTISHNKPAAIKKSFRSKTIKEMPKKLLAAKQAQTYNVG